MSVRAVKGRYAVPILCALFLHSVIAGETDRPIVALQELVVHTRDRDLRVSVVTFAESHFSLRLIDNAGSGDNPKYANLADAAVAQGCLAGCNGGFFVRTPFEPFGLMIQQGKRFGTFDPKSWLNGVVVIRAEDASLEPSLNFDPTPSVVSALQTGPWLIRAGRPEPSLDENRQARRTFIGHNARGIWALGTVSSCSLQELAELLRSETVFATIDIQSALNLDGGPSSGLWAKRASTDFYVKEGWPVRNYLGVKAKSPPAK